MAEKFLIEGGRQLNGEAAVSGYKNSAGAILSAALLTEEDCVIGNLPRCSDVFNQIAIIEQMGARVEWLDPHKIKINAKDIDPNKISFELFQKMRVSVLLIAPLMARFKEFKVPHPGGDKIGLRPINIHLDALKLFGAKIWEEGGFYHFQIPQKLKGTRVILREFSVTATEIVMMVAAMAEGETTIEIAAGEPQVQDTGLILQKMGAKVNGLGTHTIVINGIKNLNGAEFDICPDPLETGTFLIALAITGGQGTIKKTNPKHLTLFLEKMKDIGVNLKIGESEITVNPSQDFSATKIQTLPYPGFPTDLQPQTSVLLTQAQGKSLVHEPLYENRFQHLQEMRKMAADIEITDPHRAFILGKTELTGTEVNATDIRAGAALVLAALVAKGKTSMNNVFQIDRGYENFDGKLRELGADIKRV